MSQTEEELKQQVKKIEAAEAEMLAVLDGLQGNPRWIAIARTHAEEGRNAAVRALYEPVTKNGHVVGNTG